jgi:hypothetical protein
LLISVLYPQHLTQCLALIGLLDSRMNQKMKNGSYFPFPNLLYTKKLASLKENLTTSLTSAKHPNLQHVPSFLSIQYTLHFEDNTKTSSRKYLNHFDISYTLKL